MHRRTVLSGIVASLPFFSGCSKQLTGISFGLETYTNKKYGYSIKYPGAWGINENPSVTGEQPESDVTIESVDRQDYIGSESVTLTNVPSWMTLDRSVTSYVRSVRDVDDADVDTFKILDQRSFTLPSGQSATIIDTTMETPRLGPSHGKHCFAIADGTVYHIRVLFSEKYYKDDKKKATTIVESFTIKSVPGSIDVSQLNTYTNEKYGYSVKYPSGLTINDTDPSGVIFEDQQSEFVVGMATSTWDAHGQTVDALISEDVQKMKNDEDNGPVVLLEQRSFTLPSEQSATIIYAKVENISVFHVKACYAIVDGTAYRVRVLIHEDGYIASRQAATTIVESLTIE